MAIFQGNNQDSAGAAGGALTITPSDGTDLTRATRAIYVGVTGNLAVIMLDGTTATFIAVPAGALLPLMVSRILATGTTATSIVGIY